MATSKTMWSNPQKRLINSGNAIRGSAITLSKTNQIYTASSSGTQKGFVYYAHIKPAFNQVGTDTIRSRHSAD